MPIITKILSRFSFVSLLLVVSCSPSTRITGSWVKSNNTKTYDRILVAAMTEQVGVKQSVEDVMASRLQTEGVEVSKSIDVLPPKFSKDDLNDKSIILDAVKNSGHDAILTIALIDEETETRYVPGNTTYAPVRTFRYYGNFWGYYTNMYPMVYDPGYYREDRIYFVETNLYDVETEELIWSAQTETINPNSLERASENLADVTVNEMASRNLF